MKIIDLLVKISKDEEMPKKIRYEGYVWEYDKYAEDYYRNNIDGGYINLFTSLFDKATDSFINNEVEIIEEDNKIEKCKKYEDFLGIDDYIKHLEIKINELIDEVNKVKGEK